MAHLCSLCSFVAFQHCSACTVYAQFTARGGLFRCAIAVRTVSEWKKEKTGGFKWTSTQTLFVGWINMSKHHRIMMICADTAAMSSFRSSPAVTAVHFSQRAFISASWESCVALLQVLSYHATCSKTEVDKFKVTSFFLFVFFLTIPFISRHTLSIKSTRILKL